MSGLLPLALVGASIFFLGGHAVFGRWRGGPELPIAQTTDASFGVRRREPVSPRAPTTAQTAVQTTNAGFTVVSAEDGRTVALRQSDVVAMTMELTPDGRWTLALVVRGGGEVRVAFPDERAARAVFQDLTEATQ